MHYFQNNATPLVVFCHIANWRKCHLGPMCVFFPIYGAHLGIFAQIYSRWFPYGLSSWDLVRCNMSQLLAFVTFVTEIYVLMQNGPPAFLRSRDRAETKVWRAGESDRNFVWLKSTLETPYDIMYMIFTCRQSSN